MSKIKAFRSKKKQQVAEHPPQGSCEEKNEGWRAQMDQRLKMDFKTNFKLPYRMSGHYSILVVQPSFNG